MNLPEYVSVEEAKRACSELNISWTELEDAHMPPEQIDRSPK